MDDEHFPYALIIELSHHCSVTASQLTNEIRLITEGLLGPQVERWQLHPARNDMSIIFSRRSDLYRLCDRLTDLGREGLSDEASICDHKPDEVEGVDAATS